MTENKTVQHRLVGWGTFEDLTEAILARTFGIMVELAIPVVNEYHSDLFHDVTWLRANVHGEMTFEFCVRDSGTNIGPTVKYAGTSPGAVVYTMRLVCDKRHSDGGGEWSLVVTRH